MFVSLKSHLRSELRSLQHTYSIVFMKVSRPSSIYRFSVTCWFFSLCLFLSEDAKCVIRGAMK